VPIIFKRKGEGIDGEGELVIGFEHIISTTDIVPGDIPVYRVALDRISCAGDIKCETRTVSEGNAYA
jgi:hypothetical protein